MGTINWFKNTYFPDGEFKLRHIKEEAEFTMLLLMISVSTTFVKLCMEFYEHRFTLYQGFVAFILVSATLWLMIIAFLLCMLLLRFIVINAHRISVNEWNKRENIVLFKLKR